MTLDQAAYRWWDEIGIHLKSADDVDRRIVCLITLLGKNTSLADITSERITRAIQRRRGMLRRGKAPANATVNRDVIDTLRPILRRAQLAWGVTGLPAVHWGALRLAERKPRPHDFTTAEIDVFVAALPRHWQDFARLCSRYGCRLGEMFFSLDAVDVAEGRVVLRNRKAGDDHTIPITAGDAAMLATRIRRARAAGLSTPWFQELKDGRLVPLHYGGAQKAIGKAMTDCGLRASKGAKGAHDLRHHAAMRYVRATGSAIQAQRLLGHASIQSTMVYAHAMEPEVRAGLEAVSRNSPEPSDNALDKPLNQKGNSGGRGGF